MGSGRPVLQYVIFASPKSGTEWMRRLLGAHPQVVCAESRPFGRCFKPDNVSGPWITLETYLSILGRHHGAAGGAGGSRRLLYAVLDAIGRASLEATGKSIYGEKITPFEGTARVTVERLAEYDPDLRFVHLSRDGRDVAVSGLAHQRIIHERAGTAQGRRLASAVEAGRVPRDMLEFFASLWTEAVTAALEAQTIFTNFLHVRYEDLLEDTLGHARRLLEFIGADAGGAVVRACVEAASFERMSEGRRRGEEDLASVVRKGVAGDWRRWLTGEQAAWFDAGAGDLLERLGYDRAAGVVPS